MTSSLLFFFFSFWNILRPIGINSFLNICRIPENVFSPDLFIVGSFCLLPSRILVTATWIFHVFLNQFWQFVSLQEFTYYIQVNYYFSIIHFFPFKVGYNLPLSFLIIIIGISSLFPFLVSLAKVYPPFILSMGHFPLKQKFL